MYLALMDLRDHIIRESIVKEGSHYLYMAFPLVRNNPFDPITLFCHVEIRFHETHLTTTCGYHGGYSQVSGEIDLPEGVISSLLITRANDDFVLFDKDLVTFSGLTSSIVS